MAEENLEKRVIDFIVVEPVGISVKWEKLAELKKAALVSSDYRTFESTRDNLLKFLEKVGFLRSMHEKGSYAVVGDGVMGANVGPAFSVAGIRYNFKRREDAEEYLPYVRDFDGAVTPARIVQI